MRTNACAQHSREELWGGSAAARNIGVRVQVVGKVARARHAARNGT